MKDQDAFMPIVELEENLHSSRKPRELRILDWVQAAVQRMCPPLLPVERISAEQFWAEKRARQLVSYRRVADGEMLPGALFAFRAEQLRGAHFEWPKGGFSAAEDDDGASTL
jgi:hypothetical protein